MRRILFCLVATAVALASQAQTRTKGALTGRVVEKATGQAIEFATVALHDAASDTMAGGCVTDSTGAFTLDGVAPGDYTVECSFVGCQPVRSGKFTVERGRTADAGTLYLSEGEELADVVVEGRRSTFVAKLDRKVFNVGEDVMSASGSAADIMQNIPSVEVDLDGSVSLRGSDNVTILINGKPSAMMGGKTRADALSQLSASAIERIEVLTNPSAEYKPDGVGGIINIVMKKEAATGVNGSLTANAGSAGRLNAGINLNYGLRRANIFGGYSFRRDRYDRATDDHRTSPAEEIEQTTRGLGRPVSHAIRLGANINITDNDEAEVSGSYNRRRFSRDEQVESATVDSTGTLTESYSRSRDALARENMWEGAFRYTHSYGQANEWGVDYTYSSETEDEINHYSTITNGDETRDDEAVWDANYLHVGKLHWRHALTGRLSISAGYEIERLRAEQSYHVSDFDGAAFVPDAGRSSDFAHLRTLNSLYATAELKLADWGLLAGLRGERAGVENRLTSEGRTATQSYVNVFPTLHATRVLSGQSELQLNYSMRVNRPDGSDMNPFAERINPLSLQAGNADLKPEKINSLEAGWMWRADGGASLMTTLYWRHISRQITEVSRYLADGALLTTKENLDAADNAGLELIWNCPLAKWLTFNWNVNGYYNQIDATRLGYGRHRSTFSWSTLLNANFTPARHWLVQLNARLRGAQLVPQGRRDPDCRVNTGVKYDIPAINLSILGSVTDLLDTYRKSYTLDTPGLRQKVEKRRNPRIFYIGLAWQFGSGRAKGHQWKVEHDEGL